MRTVLMAAWAVVAVVSSAGAQGLGYGVKAGVNLSTFASEGEDGGTPFDIRPGFVGGAFMTWPLPGRLALQPEALFSQKGTSSEDGGGKLTQRVEYLEVPVLVSYRLFGAAGRHVSAFAGPAFGVRLRAKARASFGGDTLEQDIGDEVARTDTAIVVGGSYQRGHLLFDGRYGWGLSNIDKSAADDSTVKNRGISLTAGWRF
jgi:outer membrane protein with beta-barrel domain